MAERGIERRVGVEIGVYHGAGAKRPRHRGDKGSTGCPPIVLFAPLTMMTLLRLLVNPPAKVALEPPCTVNVLELGNVKVPPAATFSTDDELRVRFTPGA